MARYYVIDLDDNFPTVDSNDAVEFFANRDAAELRAKKAAEESPGTMFGIAQVVNAASCEIGPPVLVDV